MSALTINPGPRVAVVGTSGSGKTTVSRDLAARLGVPHLELDGLFHQPGWTQLPTPEFRARVAEVTGGAGWVIDGNYSSRVQDLVFGAADTVVWLDLPRGVVIRRLVPRTLRRMLTRQELWNGNRERWSNLFSLKPERSILAWAWTQHARYRAQYAARLAPPQPFEVVRLSSAREVRAFLQSVRSTIPSPRGSEVSVSTPER